MNITIAQCIIELSCTTEVDILKAIVTAQIKEDAEHRALARVYNLSELATRMNMGRSTLLKYLNLAECHGGIRHRRAGSIYLVSEQAVRDWFGDSTK